MTPFRPFQGTLSFMFMPARLVCGLAVSVALLCGQEVLALRPLENPDTNIQPPAPAQMLMSGTGLSGEAATPLTLGENTVSWSAGQNTFNGSITILLPAVTPPLAPAGFSPFRAFVGGATLPVTLRIKGTWTYPRLMDDSVTPKRALGVATWELRGYVGSGYAAGACATNRTAPVIASGSMSKESPFEIDHTFACTALASLDLDPRQTGTVVGMGAIHLKLSYEPVGGQTRAGAMTLSAPFRFRYGTPPDTADLTRVSPPTDLPLDFDKPIEICGLARVSIGSRDNGVWSLRVFDQDDVFVGGSPSAPIRKSEGMKTAEPCTGGITPPPQANHLKVKVVLMDAQGARVLAESAPAFLSAQPKIRIEFLQVVQTRDNKVKLNASHQTLVRVFLEQRGLGVERRTYAGILEADNRVVTRTRSRISLKPSIDPSREELSNSLNYQLPALPGFDEMEITFKLTDPAFREMGLTKTEKMILHFPWRGARIGLLPICYQPPGAAKELCPPGNVPGDKLRHLLPAQAVPSAFWTGTTKIVWEKPLDVRENLDALRARIRSEMFRRENKAGQGGSELGFDQLFGVSADLTSFRLDDGTSARVLTLGTSDPPWAKGGEGKIGWVQRLAHDATSASNLTHEVGHNLGLKHAPGTGIFWRVCQAPLADPGWPYGTPLTQEPGFNWETGKIVSPFQADIMSYCHGFMKWISPYHYNRLVDYFMLSAGERANAVTLQGNSTTTPRPAVGPAAFVSGAIAAAGGGTLEPLQFAAAVALPGAAGASGAYCVVLQGATQERSCFDVDFAEEDVTEAGGAATLSQKTFGVVVRQPANLQRVVLLKGAQELASRTASRTAPTVTILAPAANASWTEGTQRLSWRGSDADNDPLWYSVEYSSDGGAAWNDLAVNVQQTQMDIRTADIVGGSRVRFRVTASDGLREGAAEVGPINVQQRPALTLPAAPLALGSVLVDDELRAEVPVRAGQSSPLVVQSASLSGTGFSLGGAPFPLTIPAGATQPLLVNFRSAREGTFDGALSLRSNDAANPAATLRLTAVVDAAPTALAVASSTPVDFGGVTVGQSVSAAYTLGSLGSADLVISAAASSNSEFSFSPALPLTLSRGQFPLELRFRPAAAGARSGTLTLTTNDPRNRTLTVRLTGQGLAVPAAVAGQPYIRAAQPVLQTFSGTSDISANTWIEIYGTSFAPRARSWTGADFRGANGPTSLDGWSATVGGRPSVVSYIGPTQINVNVPDDTVTGAVLVQVFGPGGLRSNVASVNRLPASPALQTHPLWRVGGKNYVVAVHTASTASQTVFVGPPGLISGVALQSVKPGDTFSLYAVGCGPATGVSPGVVVSGSNRLTSPHEILIGGKSAFLSYAGYVAGAVGLVQFNVVVPDLPPGDHSIELIVDGIANRQNLVLPVAR